MSIGWEEWLQDEYQIRRMSTRWGWIQVEYKMKRMSIGWEEWAKDEKDEYRMRRWVQDEKNEYKMRRMNTWWEERVQDEKDEHRMRRMSMQDEKDEYKMSIGWENEHRMKGWVQDEKDEYRMRKMTTGRKKKWKGRVQDELRMRRGSSIHAYPYAYPPSLTRDNAVSFNLFNYLSFTNCFALYWRSWSQENIIFYTIFSITKYL